MRFISTRGGTPELAFDQVLLAGLARDGGLFVPKEWPRFTNAQIAALADKSYPELAAALWRPFIGDTIRNGADAAHAVYGRFDHQAVAPLKQLDTNRWVMELFHGPTFSFKDYALQAIGQWLGDLLQARGQRITIVGATSGDTGSAAIAALEGRPNIDIFMLHPKGRISAMQRRQMTTVDAANVFNIAIDGSFDDCQDLVKACFNDLAFRDALKLSAVNSINFARIMAQIAYYFWAALALGAPQRPVAFAVPTGNFGNVYSAYAARAMGLPIAHLMVGSNRNDILARFFASGEMKIEPVVASLSPSMDIQVSSNFERLLFDLYGHQGKAVAEIMDSFRKTGAYSVGANALAEARKLFSGYRLDDAQTLEAMRNNLRTSGEIFDPHSAIAVEGARAWRGEAPIVALATAHPGKFADAVERAIGRQPQLPAALAALIDRPEKCSELPNDLGRLQQFMRERAAVAKGA